MLHHRAKRFSPRTLDEFIGRGLYPCNGCLQEALRRDGPSVLARRVYACGTTNSFPLVTRTCPGCRFLVLIDGAFGVSVDLMREMCRRKTKAYRRRLDVEVDASSCVPTGCGHDMRHGDRESHVKDTRGRVTKEVGQQFLMEEAMRHSDRKTEFGTGAHRDTDEGKGSPSLISPVLIHRLGVLLQKGAKHYGADNWTKGMPYRRTADSMIRHIFQWLAGDTEEDHLAAVCFGAMCLMTYEEAWLQSEVRLTAGKNPHNVTKSSLDDRDEGLKKILASILTSSSKDATLKVSSMHKSVDDFVKVLGYDKDQVSIRVCKRNCGQTTVQPNSVCLRCQTRELEEMENYGS